ncbi:hypothetical protein KUTeg_000069 [Tegillarca granosa]|uniref:Uncharacterized protein n=1 Tax=Tegillarca granosa TaxID=220873 RepID=A0ABQ9G0W2_TEGGR|nr:hypothetical protein KUTeg_000069 [Tegillarca granosa]
MCAENLFTVSECVQQDFGSSSLSKTDEPCEPSASSNCRNNTAPTSSASDDDSDINMDCSNSTISTPNTSFEQRVITIDCGNMTAFEPSTRYDRNGISLDCGNRTASETNSRHDRNGTFFDCGNRTASETNSRHDRYGIFPDCGNRTASKTNTRHGRNDIFPDCGNRTASAHISRPFDDCATRKKKPDQSNIYRNSSTEQDPSALSNNKEMSGQTLVIENNTNDYRKRNLLDGKPRGFQHVSYANYKAAKDCIRRVQKAASEKHLEETYSDIDRAAGLDIRLFWKLINAKRKKTNKVYPEIIVNGEMFTNPEEVAGAFSLYFEQVYERSDGQNFDGDFEQLVENAVDKLRKETIKEDELLPGVSKTVKTVQFNAWLQRTIIHPDFNRFLCLHNTNRSPALAWTIAKCNNELELCYFIIQLWANPFQSNTTRYCNACFSDITEESIQHAKVFLKIIICLLFSLLFLFLVYPQISNSAVYLIAEKYVMFNFYISILIYYLSEFYLRKFTNNYFKWSATLRKKYIPANFYATEILSVWCFLMALRYRSPYRFILSYVKIIAMVTWEKITHNPRIDMWIQEQSSNAVEEMVARHIKEQKLNNKGNRKQGNCFKKLT